VEAFELAIGPDALALSFEAEAAVSLVFAADVDVTVGGAHR
jgi:hypothetical protein